MDRRITRQLVAKARTQYGLLCEADLALIDPTRSVAELVRSCSWNEVLPGVVAPAALEPTTELLESACMLWTRRGMLSHVSAARKSGIWVPDDERAWLSVDFTDPRRSLIGVQISRTRQLPPRHLTNGFHRWTYPDRTLVDLAGSLTRRQLEAVLLSAIRKKATTAEAVRAQAQLVAKRPSTQLAFDVVALWTAERESFLEDLVYGDVCSVVTERVERQYVIARANGSVQARLDVAVPELLLDFEGDGLLFHSSDEQIAADQARDRGLFKRGWHTTRFREGVLDNRLAVRREIREVVERRRRDLGRRAA